jgi:CRISPR-associated endonuclease/helicase Cas3
MALYPYQERVDTLLRAGRNVILQAPTGAGKTRAALFPFLDSWRNDAASFPRQCIYAVPMRVLANQFEAEYEKTVAAFSTRFGFAKTVAVQTGARPDNREFEADLLFTTIDQVLSSALTIPYSLSNRLANLNAGAVVGSYLVFDEFHLFPVDEDGGGALATSLHLLTMLKNVTPFVLMTATFSKTMLDELCTLLDADAVTLTLDEIQAIPSQKGKQRRYRYITQLLDAEAVISDFAGQKRQRAITVCNTVQRAQDLARDLRADSRLAGVEIELLHSRFYASDREEKEKMIRREFGKDRSAYQPKPMILVATQVIEVGLNITCEVLHTEMAPASAIVQRAGRCARFEGEHGTVCIYDVPPNNDGEPDYAPYIDGRPRRNSEAFEGQSKLCERTQQAFAALPSDGQVLSYHDELALVNSAHEAYDRRLLEQLRDNSDLLRDEVVRVLRDRDRTAARDLIREVDNRSLLIHDNPNETTLPNPYHHQSIGLRRNALLRWYRDIQAQAMEQAVDWIIKIPTFVEPDGISKDDGRSEGAEQRRKVEIVWRSVHRPSSNPKDIQAASSDIISNGLIVVNPVLVQYGAALGLRLVPGAPAENSPPAPPKGGKKPMGALRSETYDEHIAGLQRVYVDRLHERTAAVRHRFEQRLNLESGTLDQAIRMMFAAHDIGKLDRRWQTWAHEWQKKVSVLRDNPALIVADDVMLAHTDYDSSDLKEREANRRHSQKFPRPHHATESALSGRQLIAAITGDCVPLHCALMSAIICHHNPNLRYDHDEFKPANGAKAAFDKAMKSVGLFDDTGLRASGANVWWEGFPAGAQLGEDTVDLRRADEMLLYLLLVRVLRLSDQGSQERDL